MVTLVVVVMMVVISQSMSSSWMSCREETTFLCADKVVDHAVGVS